MIVWIVVFVVVVALSIFVATVALPRMYLKLRYTIERSKDRCIKRVYEKDGQSMVFEPEEKWRGYIEQYVLSERKGQKVVMCKVNEELSYIEFDVVVFNAFNKVSEVIKVQDNVAGSGYTKTVELPEDASYLSLCVVRADNKKFRNNLTARSTVGKRFAYYIINAVTVIMEIVAFKICLANILGEEFRESVIFNEQGTLISIILALVLVVVNTIIVAIDIRVRDKKLRLR